MNLLMNELERRVLGVMIEKQLTTGDYPMTLNALTAGCNQKSNRDPVLELDEDAVWNTVEALRERGLVARVLPPMGSRVDRFKHEIDAKLQWPKAHKAVLCELLLRGPQTPGELRTRASRMYPFETVDAVAAVLDALAAADPPLAAALPRVPGQREVRHTHLFYPPGQQPAVAAATARSSASAESLRESTGGQAAGPPPRPAAADDLAAVQRRLEGLQSEVADLHEQIAGLRRRLEALEGR